MNLYSRLISIRLSNFRGAHCENGARTAANRRLRRRGELSSSSARSIKKKRGRNRAVLLQFAKLEKFFRPHKFNPRFYSELLFRRYPDNLQGRDFYSSRNSWCPHRRVGNNQKSGAAARRFYALCCFFRTSGLEICGKIFTFALVKTDGCGFCHSQIGNLLFFTLIRFL